MGEDLRLEGVSVDFAGEPGSGKQKRRVLDIPEFSLEAGDMAVLEGPSGTGKTFSSLTFCLFRSISAAAESIIRLNAAPSMVLIMVYLRERPCMRA